MGDGKGAAFAGKNMRKPRRKTKSPLRKKAPDKLLKKGDPDRSKWILFIISSW
ncbi:MAG: hypothetical protein V2A78_05140 [bacterium]